MKKPTIILLILVLLLSFVFVACGESNDTQPTVAAVTHEELYEQNEYTPTADEALEYVHNETEEPEDQAEPVIHGFALQYRGIFIEMDQNMDYVLAQLGEPLGVFEAPSCAFDGIDRIFGFPGIQIHTYPDGDLDRVHTISFLDDSLSTTNGIFLGSSWDDVVAIYGNDYVQDVAMFTYTIDRTTLSFFVEGDVVMGIIYGLIMD